MAKSCAYKYLHSSGNLSALRVKKIVSIQEEDEAPTLEAPICLLITNNDEPIYSAWSVDPDDREEIQDRLESLNGGMSSKKIQIICLDSKEVLFESVENSLPLIPKNNMTSSLLGIESNLSNRQKSSMTSSLFGKSSQSAPSDSKAKAIQAVKERLQNYPLHSPKMIGDFGSITYQELFDKLLANPNATMNMKWISMFKHPISDTWTHPCLEALRWFYRKF